MWKRFEDMVPGGQCVARESRSGIPGADDAERYLWTLLLATSVLYFFWNSEADNDLWGHLRFGRDMIATGAVPHVDTYAYTTSGLPWVNHEWLTQAVMAALYDWTGSAGLLIAKFAFTVVTFLLVLAGVRRHAESPHIRGGLGLLVVAILSRGGAPRPQLVTYFFVALTLFLLDTYGRGRRSALWCFPGIFLIWANMHGGFVLGLGILGLFAFATLLTGSKRTVAPWLALFFSAGITALNPYGSRLLLYILNELSRAHPITEWQPAQLEAAQFAFFILFVLFIATLWFAPDWRRNGWRTLLALGVGVLALRQQRHTPLFALCAAAPVASQLAHAMRPLKGSAFTLGLGARRIICGAMALLAILQLGLTAQRVGKSGLRIVYDPTEYPVAAVHALHDAGVHGNVAVPLDWGEYVLWFLAPEVKVSLDGRFATVFPETVVEDNFNFFTGAPGWRRLIEAYPTNAALVPLGRFCPVRTLPDWRLAYRDNVAEVYVRAGDLTKLGLQDLPLNRPVSPLQFGVFP